MLGLGVEEEETQYDMFTEDNNLVTEESLLSYAASFPFHHQNQQVVTAPSSHQGHRNLINLNDVSNTNFQGSLLPQSGNDFLNTMHTDSRQCTSSSLHQREAVSRCLVIKIAMVNSKMIKDHVTATNMALAHFGGMIEESNQSRNDNDLHGQNVQTDPENTSLLSEKDKFLSKDDLCLAKGEDMLKSKKQ